MTIKMHSINLDATDGKDTVHSWGTKINGTHASVAEYYFCNEFNIGRDDDLMVQVHAITFSDGIRLARCPNPQGYELIMPDTPKVYVPFGTALDILDGIEG
jgi:hypothetical protein